MPPVAEQYIRGKNRVKRFLNFFHSSSGGGKCYTENAMGHRLSKIYTRTGDDGSTGLADGGRVDKDDPRVEAMGCVDELNSAIGLLASALAGRAGGDGDAVAAVRDALCAVQHCLFELGGELALPGEARMAAADVAALEQALDRLNAGLAPLREFILPGGVYEAALAHLARAVCRRAERRLHTCGKTFTLNPASAQYLNRLSDFLFVAARALNRGGGGGDILWQNRTGRR